MSSLCLITSINSPNWNTRHKFKGKCLSSEPHPSAVAYTGFPYTGGNWSKSSTSMTINPANSVSVEHMKISSSWALIWKNKSLETIENSLIITIFTSDNLFLKHAFILSLIPRPEWIVVPPIFIADMSIGPKRRTRGLSGSLEW